MPFIKSVTSKEKSIKKIVQQTGYKRIKRGYKSLEDLQTQFPEYKPPQDPYFKYQWYLVSKKYISSELKIKIRLLFEK